MFSNPSFLSVVLLLPSTALGATLEVPGAFVDVNAALAAAVAGDTIVVSTNGGTYPAFTVNLDDVTIVAGETGRITGAYGVGYNASISPQVTIDGGGGLCIEVTGTQNVTIAGFILTNCSVAINAAQNVGNLYFGNVMYSDDVAAYRSTFEESTTFTGNELRNASGTSDFGVMMDNGERNTISDNTIRNYAEEGILISAGRGTTILNNDIQHTVAYAVRIGANAERITTARNLTVNNNSGGVQIEYDAGTTDGEAVGNNTANTAINTPGSNSQAQND
ncbi:MAG: right-handed parallel beta-helix repeat-containing protein [Myxococcota bacterium]